MAMPRGGIVGYDDGGMVPQYSGIAPSAATENPAEQQTLSRFAALPDEKLQEIAMQLGNTGQGQVAQRVLMQRRTMPNAPQSGIGLPQQRRGGDVQHYADGGEMSWEQGAKMASHTASATTGFLHSIVPGRTDLIHANPPMGAYVIPADIVSGLAEGNSLAGAHIISQALQTGPFGMALPKRGGSGGVKIPSPPPAFSGAYQAPAAKRGGRQNERDVGKPTPILAAGGEYIVSPDVVRAWGHGDLKKGHDVLDHWVTRKRKEIAREMLSLPGPKHASKK